MGISRWTWARNLPIRLLLSVAASMLLATLIGASVARAQDLETAEFNFTFEADAEGWTPGFADLPVDYEQSIFELDHGHRPLPDGLEGNAYYLRGHNRSDDLFMYLKTQVGGLRGNATYLVEVSVDLATNVAAGSFGIGGSPGESVFVKAGASAIEPEAGPDSNQYLRMNIDKGNQSGEGEAMLVIGNVAHPDVMGNEYRIKSMDNAGRPLPVKTDSEGRMWLIVGTDSGFEGLTTLYFDRISYTLQTMKPPNTGGLSPPLWAMALLVALGALLIALGLMLLRGSGFRGLRGA